MVPRKGLSNRQVRTLLLSTQFAFFAVLVACVLIDHSAVAQKDGISFYAVYHKTVELLVLGFLVSAIGLWRTSSYFATGGAPRIAVVGLRVVAVGLVGLLVTPYNRGTFFNWSHMCIGTAMALVQLAMSARLLVAQRTPRVLTGFVVQLAGGLIAAASLPDWRFDYLGAGEAIFEVGFSWCLVEWTYALYERQGEQRLAR